MIPMRNPSGPAGPSITRLVRQNRSRNNRGIAPRMARPHQSSATAAIAS
jgi:hypothetical protein